MKKTWVLLFLFIFLISTISVAKAASNFVGTWDVSGTEWAKVKGQKISLQVVDKITIKSDGTFYTEGCPGYNLNGKWTQNKNTITLTPNKKRLERLVEDIFSSMGIEVVATIKNLKLNGKMAKKDKMNLKMDGVVSAYFPDYNNKGSGTISGKYTATRN